MPDIITTHKFAWATLARILQTLEWNMSVARNGIELKVECCVEDEISFYGEFGTVLSCVMRPKFCK